MPDPQITPDTTPPAAGDTRLAYAVDEACHVASLSRALLYQHIKTGTLRTLKVGGRRLILRDDLQAFLQSFRAA